MKKYLLASLIVFGVDYASAMQNYPEVPMRMPGHQPNMHLVNSSPQQKCYEQNKSIQESKKQIDRKNKSIKSSNQNWNSGTFYSHRKEMK